MRVEGLGFRVEDSGCVRTAPIRKGLVPKTGGYVGDVDDEGAQVGRFGAGRRRRRGAESLPRRGVCGTRHAASSCSDANACAHHQPENGTLRVRGGRGNVRERSPFYRSAKVLFSLPQKDHYRGRRGCSLRNDAGTGVKRTRTPRTGSRASSSVGGRDSWSRLCSSIFGMLPPTPQPCPAIGLLQEVAA